MHFTPIVSAIILLVIQNILEVVSLEIMKGQQGTCRFQTSPDDITILITQLVT